MAKTQEQTGAPRGWLSAIIRLTILGGLVTAVVLAALPPDLPSPAPVPTGESADRLLIELTRARADAKEGETTRIPWTLVNSLIADHVNESVIEGMQLIPVSLRHCTLTAIDDQSFQVVMERKFFDYSIFSSVRITAEKSRAGYTMKVGNGSIGRLPLPGPIVVKLSPGLAELTGPFAAELEILRDSESVTLSPESLAVTF